MAAKVAGSDRLELMRAPGGLYAVSVEKTEDGALQVGEGSIVDAIAFLRPDDRGSMIYDVLTLVYDTVGRLVYTAPTARFNLWDVPVRGILIVKDGDSVRKVVR